jgi:hypothetical protein
MVGPVTRRAVPMSVQPLLTWQEAIERVEEVVIRPRPDLDDDQPGRRMRDEDRQQPVVRADIGNEGSTGWRQVGQAPCGAGPDRQLACVYGKMLRRASRIRPSPPIAGADSYRRGSPSASVVAPHESSPTAVL